MLRPAWMARVQRGRCGGLPRLVTIRPSDLSDLLMLLEQKRRDRTRKDRKAISCNHATPAVAQRPVARVAGGPCQSMFSVASALRAQLSERAHSFLRSASTAENAADGARHDRPSRQLGFDPIFAMSDNTRARGGRPATCISVHI
jgi:hypothetical protein